MPPSSAWMSASTIIMRPPTIQEMIAAGPAAIRPSWAPKSQPEPMIEPTEAHIRPIRPTSRRRDDERRAGAGAGELCTDMPSTSRALSPKVWPDGQTINTLGPATRDRRALDAADLSSRFVALAATPGQRQVHTPLSRTRPDVVL